MTIPTLPDRFAPLCAEAAEAGFDLDLSVARAEEAARAVAARAEAGRLQRLVLVGSGDSLFAARAMLPALRRFTGLYVEAPSSLAFARYEIPLVDARDLVVAISNSGNSTRTREGLSLAKARGVPTLGISGSDTGPLAQSADILLHRPATGAASAPESVRRVFLNMAEYCAALVALAAFGLSLGVARGHLDARERARRLDAIRETLALVGPAAEAIEPAIASFVAGSEPFDTIWTLGGGPNWGSAEYSAAKFHEQVPINGVAQDLEEWAHLQYFLTLNGRAHGPVLVLAPSGNGLDRAQEMLEGIADAGGTALVASDAEIGPAALRLPMPTGDELLSPITYQLPAQLVALHVARTRAAAPIPLRRGDDYRLIREGRIRTDADGLA